MPTLNVKKVKTVVKTYNNQAIQRTATCHHHSDQQTKELSIVSQLTSICNLGCLYCYMPEETPQFTVFKAENKGSIKSQSVCHRIMPDSVLNRIFEIAENSAEQYSGIRFIWHGGEPLLAGIQTFKKIQKLSTALENTGLKVAHSLQTNGTLLTEEFANFFGEWEAFKVGISLDGDMDTHNRTRRYKNGAESFTDVYRSIELLRKVARRKMCLPESVMPEVGVLLVVNRQNITELQNIFDFCLKQKLTIRFNPIFISGHAKGNEDLVSITPDEYADAIIPIFDKWLLTPEDTENVQFSNLLASVLYNTPTACSFLNSCQGAFLGIDTSGTVYPCARFAGNQDFSYGSIENYQSFGEITRTALFQQLIQRPANLIQTECRDCSHFEYCYGGCLHNAFAAGNVYSRDSFCKSYRRIFTYIQDFITSELGTSEG